MRWRRGGNPFVRHEFLLTLERTGCVGAGTGWMPCHLLLQDRQRRDRSCAAALQQERFVGRVRLRLELGARLRSRLACATTRSSSACRRSRRRPALACSRKTHEARARLAAALIEHARDAARVVCSPSVRHRCGSRRARVRRLSLAQGLPVPLAQPRLPELRCVPGDVPLRKAQEGPARAAARAGERHQLPHAARRGNGRAAVGDRVRILRRHVRRARPRALSQRGLLPLGVRSAARTRSS